MPPDSPSNVPESTDDSQLNRDPQLTMATTHGLSSLEGLPDELLINVIRNCEPEITSPMAWNLCLVSRRIQPVATQELYRGITISTYVGLKNLCRTLADKPTLRQHILELKLLVKYDDLEALSTGFNFEGRDTPYLYCDVLKQSPKLKKLSMMLVHASPTRIPSGQVRYGFIDRLSKAITQSQQSGSTNAILPRLHHVQLTASILSQDWSHGRVTYTQLFKPFLQLPSLESLEVIHDSGSWDSADTLRSHARPSTPGMHLSSSLT